MEPFTLRELGRLLWGSRLKILLTGLLFTLAISPAAYFLVPSRYHARTALRIPYTGAEIAGYEIGIRGEVLPGVYEQLNMAGYGLSLPAVDRDLYIALDGPNKLIHYNFLGDDAALVASFIYELNLETLNFAREQRIAALREEIEMREEQIAANEEILEDERFTEYYDRLFQTWVNLLQVRSNTRQNIFIEIDPLVKNLMLEQKNLRRDIARMEREITALTKEDETVLEKHFTPVYLPEQKLPPRLPLVALAAAMGGLLIGIFRVFLGVLGTKSSKKEGI